MVTAFVGNTEGNVFPKRTRFPWRLKKKLTRSAQFVTIPSRLLRCLAVREACVRRAFENLRRWSALSVENSFQGKQICTLKEHPKKLKYLSTFYSPLLCFLKMTLKIEDLPPLPPLLPASYTSSKTSADPLVPRLVDVHVDKLRARKIASLKEWMENPENLYIGRRNHYVGVEASKWQNPFPVGKRYTLEESVQKYEEHVKKNLLSDLPELRRVKEIGCWCCENPGVSTSTPRCHGEVLINLLHSERS